MPLALTPQRTDLNRYWRSPLGVRGVADCLTLRRWDMCELDDSQTPCVNQVDHVWLCDEDPPQCAQSLRYLNACYSRTDFTLPAAEVPPDDVLISDANVVCSSAAGCNDPLCTDCARYYAAVLCGGQGAGAPPFRIVVPASQIPDGQCYGFSYTYGGKNWCYTVRRGNFTSKQGSDDQSDAIAGLRCCDCVEGCTHFVGTLRLYCPADGEAGPLDCCCPDSYSFKVSFRYDWNRDDAVFNSNSGLTEHTRYEFIPPLVLEGTGRVVNGGVPTWDGPGGAAPTLTGVLRSTSNDGINAPVIIDYPYTLSLNTAGAESCVPDFAQWSLDFGPLNPFFGGFQVQTYCVSDPVNPDGPYVVVTNATSGRTCTVAGVQNIWHRTGWHADGVPGLGSSENGALLTTVAITASGEKCAEGCEDGQGLLLADVPLLFSFL